MKQHITVEQLNELSEQGKEKLREWWKPELDHIVAHKDYEQGVPLYVLVDSNMKSGWSFEQAMEDIVILPRLSIGQMIEFLYEKLGEIEIYGVDMTDWVVSYDCNDSGEWEKKIGKKELCDALWEAVKEVLKNK